MDPENTAEMVAYEKRYWYPHMMPFDVAIWERFIAKFPDVYDTCQYDVKVGSVPEFDTTVNAESGATADSLYKKKIDVVAYKADRINIIELKPKAGASAVGQVKNYRRLYNREFNPPAQPTCVIITDEAKPDFIEFAKEEGVLVVVV